MIKFYIIGQTIRFATPAIAADSLNYLECEFDFSGEGWEEASKWAHFRQGETVFDIAIEDNRISADKRLNLTIGEWEVYITGTVDESRLTTVPVILTVCASGLIDAPLHEIPQTVAEQIDAKASTALLMAQAVKDAADSGAFRGEDGADGKDGKDGNGIEIGDYFSTLSELEQNAPKDNKLYGVGSDPVIFYGWSDSQQSWIYVGSVQGIPGEDGAQGAPGTPGRDGVIFYPAVSDSGFLSWTNDGGLENPQTVNIMGPKGDTGETGANGKGPYEYAQEGGYTGTEATFIAAMTQFPYHHERHEVNENGEEGPDCIKVTTGMIVDGAVTGAKLGSDAKALSFTGKTVASSAWVSDSTYTGFGFRAAIACEGVTAKHYPEVILSPGDALSGNYAPTADSYAGGVYIYAASKPADTLTILNIVCIPT